MQAASCLDTIWFSYQIFFSVILHCTVAGGETAAAAADGEIARLKHELATKSQIIEEFQVYSFVRPTPFVCIAHPVCQNSMALFQQLNDQITAELANREAECAGLRERLQKTQADLAAAQSSTGNGAEHTRLVVPQLSAHTEHLRQQLEGLQQECNADRAKIGMLMMYSCPLAGWGVGSELLQSNWNQPSAAWPSCRSRSTS